MQTIELENIDKLKEVLNENQNKSEVQIFNLIKEIAAHEGFDLLEAVKRKMKINKERVF